MIRLFFKAAAISDSLSKQTKGKWALGEEQYKWVLESGGDRRNVNSEYKSLQKYEILQRF